MSRTYKLDYTYGYNSTVPVRWKYRSKYGGSRQSKYYKEHYAGNIRSAERDTLHELEADPERYDELTFKEYKKRIDWEMW